MAGFEESALRALIGGLGDAFKVIKGNGVQQTKDRSEAVLQALEELVKKDVLVGIPADKAQREDGDSLGNAARLHIHEFGAPEANIPERPTVMPGIENAREQINRYFGSAGKKALQGDRGAVDVALNSAGIAAVDAIKEMINSNVPPPLSERTLADRRARGVTRENTLVDIGEMRNAVTYVVRDKTSGSESADAAAV